MQLNDVPEGAKVKVLSFKGGAQFYNRLASMGICEKSLIKIVKNPGYGPLVIQCEGKRFGMGRGMAEKIKVEKEEVGNG
ncbi:MAG: FeoA family protein [bacterium]